MYILKSTRLSFVCTLEYTIFYFRGKECKIFQNDISHVCGVNDCYNVFFKNKLVNMISKPKKELHSNFVFRETTLK
jgi:hypothetical protein